MTSRDSSNQPEEYGITEEDMGQIKQYLNKEIHTRSVDDLRLDSD